MSNCDSTKAPGAVPDAHVNSRFDDVDAHSAPVETVPAAAHAEAVDVGSSGQEHKDHTFSSMFKNLRRKLSKRKSDHHSEDPQHEAGIVDAHPEGSN